MTTANALNLNIQPATSFSTYIDQGAWTPTIVGTTAAGVGTYTLQSGFYTRIANLVFVGGVVTWTAHTGTGNMNVGGLPFASRNIANYSYDLILVLSSVNLPAGTVQVMGEVGQNTTEISLQTTRDNNTNLFVVMDTAGSIDITGFYLI